MSINLLLIVLDNIRRGDIHMGRLIDLTDNVFERLKVIKRTGTDKQRNPLWLCKCECEKEVIVRGNLLKSGNTKSCGCLQKDVAAKLKTTHSLSIDKNGVVPRLYASWRNMKSRCFNPNTPKFKNHGGRGITVCEEWLDYLPFHEWATSHGYRKDLTLERTNNDGNYEPGNCKWSTAKEQANNKRTTKIIEINNERHTQSEWLELWKSMKIN